MYVRIRRLRKLYEIMVESVFLPCAHGVFTICMIIYIVRPAYYYGVFEYEYYQLRFKNEQNKMKTYSRKCDLHRVSKVRLKPNNQAFRTLKTETEPDQII